MLLVFVVDALIYERCTRRTEPPVEVRYRGARRGVVCCGPRCGTGSTGRHGSQPTDTQRSNVSSVATCDVLPHDIGAKKTSPIN